MSIWTADDNSAINFEIHGNEHGPTLLLLPGLLGTANQWSRFVAPLAADFRVVLVDLRGHGRSENRAATLEPEQMVRDILGLLEHLGVDATHVAGYSLGGYLGLMLHLNEPRRVSSLLMHATKFYWTAESIANLRQQLDPDQLAEKVPSYANQLAADHGANRWRTVVRQAADLVVRLGETGLTERAARRAQLPVLVSVGDRDELVTLAEALRLSRVLAEGQLLVLPGVRHPLASAPAVPLLPTMQYFHQGAGRHS
ncbi:MAG: alpha/beta hydrolase [Anaerolineae bacterium]|nr:alpha/beta hydrolase [Anaerolineae bacterium]